MIQINCNITGTSASVDLILSNGAGVTGVYESPNRIIFKLNDIAGGFLSDFKIDDLVIYPNYVIPQGPGAFEGPSLTVKPLIEPLHISRDQFLLPDGTNYNWQGHIDFMLFKRSLDGVVIEPLLDQRYLAGSKAVVTLQMAWFIEQFIPSNYPNYFAHIKPFADALAAKGFNWTPIVFADAQVIMQDKSEQIRFLNQIAAEFAQCSNVYPSLCNEYQKNGIDPSIFNKPVGNLWSRGSSVGDAEAFRPGWDWKEWHARRDWPKVLFGNDDMWYVKEGIDSNGQMLDYPMPCISGEPIGFWNQNIPGRRSNDPNLARVVGGTSIYFGRGGNFMSEQGLRCDPWDTITFNCAVEFFKGINQ